MAKPDATYEYDWKTPNTIQDDYERTEAHDQCDPMMGLAPGFISEKIFDWGEYYGD